jgi:TolA-binding protein
MKSTVKLTLCLVALSATSGCSSWIDSSRKLIDDEEAKQAKEREKVESKWVKRSEYNDLLTKYNNLNDKHESLSEQSMAPKTSFDQIDELSRSTPQATKPTISNSSNETVDVFGDGGLANEVEKLSADVGTGSISRELKTYKKAMALKDSGRVDDALRIFQFLEKSKFGQIQVRARMEIGSIYLEKNQYDLSLQVFEKVITSNAFSGKVLEALKGAVASSDGLGLTDKKLRYQSMLKDFFGIQS